MADQFIYVGTEELALLTQVVQSQELWRGTGQGMVATFEDEFAAHLGRRYVHANASGTCANEAALAALGLAPGDEVIVTPCSFIASSLAPIGLGLVPVFADVDMACNLDPAEVERQIREAIEFHLEGMREDGSPIPPPSSKVDYVEVAA